MIKIYHHHIIDNDQKKFHTNKILFLNKIKEIFKKQFNPIIVRYSELILSSILVSFG